jgi:hypothetical protein
MRFLASCAFAADSDWFVLTFFFEIYFWLSISIVVVAPPDLELYLSQLSALRMDGDWVSMSEIALPRPCDF